MGTREELLAKHWAPRERAILFDPIDDQTLAEIVCMELVEPGARDGRPTPERAARLVPTTWRDDVTRML